MALHIQIQFPNGFVIGCEVMGTDNVEITDVHPETLAEILRQGVTQLAEKAADHPLAGMTRFN